MVVAHCVCPHLWIMRENQGRIMPVDFFEEDILLPILAAFHQMLLLAS